MVNRSKPGTITSTQNLAIEKSVIDHKLNSGLFILLSLLWGGSFVGIKYVVNVFPPLFGAMLRVGIALFVFFLIAKISRKATYLPFRERWKIWILGIMTQGLPFFFLFWGERFITPGLAGILNGTVPIFVFILSVLVLRHYELFSCKKIIGLLFGITGVIIIFLPFISLDNIHQSLYGCISLLFMAISYAVGTLMNQSLFAKSNGISFYANIYHQHWGSLSFLCLTSIILEKWPSWPVLTTASSGWLAALYLGIFSTAIAWTIYYHLIKEWGAVRASTVTYVVPITALFLDFAILHTIPLMSEIVGMIVIIVGVLLLQL